MKKKSKNKKNKKIINNNIENFFIDVTPHKSLLPKIGEGGHNFNEAVAQLIDNSIDARTFEQLEGKEVLNINIVINAKKKFFSIADNGIGMNRKSVEDSGKLAKSNKTSNMLGSYGLGMEGGLLSISDNFVLSSTMRDSKERIEFRYEGEKWMDNPDWKLPAKSYPKENIEEHGTIIKIDKVTKIELNPAKTQYLKANIAKRYRSFIKSGAVKITVNNVIVKVEEIDWIEGYPKEFNIPTKYGEVFGKIGLMKESSQKGNFGFDLLRNSRMIETNSKFAISLHSTIARIVGDVNLNFVKVSFEKNKFTTESPEYEEAENICRKSQIFKDIIKEARKKAQEGDNKKENVNIHKCLMGYLPFLTQALKELEYDLPTTYGEGKALTPSDKGKIVEGIIKGIEDEKRKRGPNTGKPKPRKKNEEDTTKADLILVNGQQFKLVDEYVFERNMGRKSIEFDENNGIFHICINKAYAGYVATKDKNSYCIETIVDGINDYIFKDKQSLIDDINEHKENLLRITLKLGEPFKDTFEWNGESEETNPNYDIPEEDNISEVIE